MILTDKQIILARAWTRLRNKERAAIQNEFENCEDLNTVRNYLDELSLEYIKLMDKFVEGLKD